MNERDMNHFVAVRVELLMQVFERALRWFCHGLYVLA